MNFNNQFINLFAEITQSNLKKQIQFLRVENQILRSHYVKHKIFLTEREKNKIIRLALPLGSDVKKLISIVHYSTFRNWIQDLNCPRIKQKDKRGRPPKITLAIKQLIVHMAKHNKWGYTKILGELKKLGVIKTAKTTIKNVLKEYGIDPLNYRREDTWDDFLKRTFQTLWACDFFSKSVWTISGRKLYHVLFFINIKTRKVHIAGITNKPDSAWIKESLGQIKPFLENSDGKCALVRDRDGKFSQEFDEFFKANNFNVLKIPFRSPNLNPYDESWVATMEPSLLNFIPFL
ncbi:MAG: helix-turn-helix domain-containing protein [Candidatus Omnitrophica bacterium]|nr:helix-turn-helix domain-containing protein [Candidatus Omnitrophota bacterium]